MKIFPTAELQRTTHHSEWYILYQKWFLVPSILGVVWPERIFINKKVSQFNKTLSFHKPTLGGKKKKKSWLLLILKQRIWNLHLLSWRNLGLCRCLEPSQNHRFWRRYCLTRGYYEQPGPCGCTAKRSKQLHTLPVTTAPSTGLISFTYVLSYPQRPDNS